MRSAEPGALYAETRDRFVAVMRSLDPGQAAISVPLSPEWKVSDVAAHVCGIAADVVSGRLEGLGTDAWTARQVDERVGRSLAEICDEWLNLAEPIGERIAATPFLGVRLTGDLIVHLQDVQHALGLSIETNDEATSVAAARYIPQLQERVQSRLGVSIVVELSNGSRFSAGGDASGEIVLRATPYDFLRSVTGRRSRRQVEDLDWHGDPSAVLDDAWNAYGSFPLVDISV